MPREICCVRCNRTMVYCHYRRHLQTCVGEGRFCPICQEHCNLEGQLLTDHLLNCQRKWLVLISLHRNFIQLISIDAVHNGFLCIILSTILHLLKFWSFIPSYFSAYISFIDPELPPITPNIPPKEVIYPQGFFVWNKVWISPLYHENTPLLNCIFHQNLPQNQLYFQKIRLRLTLFQYIGI